MIGPIYNGEHTIYEEATGQITHRGGNRVHLEPGQAWIVGTYYGATHWISPLGVDERPAKIEPVLTGRTMTFGALPLETVVTVWNKSRDVLTFTLLQDSSLTFSDPGHYIVGVKPPFPHHTIEPYEFEVI